MKKCGNLKIDTENILPIIKQWLYSDKEIFLRELISNGCDAIHKCKVLKDHEKLSIEESSFQIDLTIDKEKKILTFSDTGLGMSAEEIEKYIAQLAFSGAEEFLSKYKTEKEQDQIIGHFGLGFYSAYMVADKVTIDSLSYVPGSEPAFWSCDGSSSYELGQGTRTSRGTTITLYLSSEAEEFLEEAKVKTLLQKYCAFLPVPIHLNGKQINAKDPLWLKSSADCTDKEYIDFYHQLYPLEPDPIFWIHLNVDYPFNLKGILYFPKITDRFDWNQNTIKLFCNRVYVSDNCKDILPDYLMVLRGAIDSPDIPLNVSRSTLQVDRTVRQLSQHISKKVSDRLLSLYTTHREQFIQTWPDIEWIIKLGILQDDKWYERLKSLLIWQQTNKDWTTVEEYIERNRSSHENKIFYVSQKHSHSHILDLYQAKGMEVLYAPSPIDNHLMSFLESKLDKISFQRIDGALDETILDKTREHTLLDTEGRTEAAKMADFIRSKLQIEHLEVEAKSLVNDTVPALLVIDEHMRRMRETMALTKQSFHLPSKNTFVVNTNNKLVQKAYQLETKEPELAKELVHHIYELSLLSQKELAPESLSSFILRSNRVLEKMASFCP
ncbi:MAG: molecular chaperone HtpG [Chlamydiales bacterium]|jgi:molecular chaperone HtpG|nr:molecular chaperone HtpG [Chlamydiales bacterium]